MWPVAVRLETSCDMTKVCAWSGERHWWLALPISIAAVIVAAGLFLPQQGLWVDEATQLRGIELGPVGVTRWLAGDKSLVTDVPDDRMPPLSYWMGWGWACIFGFGEAPQRWLSVWSHLIHPESEFARNI